MPEVCRFYGIIIRFYYREIEEGSNYGEHEALIEIESGRIHEGYLPAKALQLVEEWRSLHVEDLREAWRRSREQMPLQSIDPLE